LTEYLKNCGADEISLTFEQVANIVGGLPQCAYDYYAPWYSGGILGTSALTAGYKAKLSQQTVTFYKNILAKKVTPQAINYTSPAQVTTLEISKAINSICKYHYSTADGIHTRYRSWEHCYKAFQDSRNYPDKVDYLCLHLAWYLASWGMLRNSFLLDHDYLVHKPVVIELVSEKYELLYQSEHTAEIIPLTLEAAKTIRRSYGDSPVTDTLITKILLGVFGCTPAYDRYFKDSARKYKV